MTPLTVPDDWPGLVVEREEAVALAGRVADDLVAGNSSLVHVTATPGSGLTTVLGGIAAEARARGALVARARCSPDEVGAQFRTAWQFLAALGVEVSDTEDVAADVMLPLCQSILDLARQRPVVIVVDDAQWLDRASFELLRALLRRMGQVPVVVVAGATVLCPSMTITAELERCGAVTHDLKLAHLTRQGIDAVVTAVFGRSDPDFVAALAEHTDGLPAVVRRVLTVLSRTGGTPSAAAVPRVAALATSAIRDRIDLRIRSLPPGSRRLLHAIALCENVFDAHEAASIAGLTSSFGREVDVLGASCMLVRRSDPKLAHPIVGDRVLALATRADREELHGKAAELAHRAALADETVARLLLGAAPVGTAWALHALHSTAKYHLQRGEHRDAVRMLDRALSEPVTPVQRARLLVECGAVETSVSPDAGDRRLTAALATGGSDLAPFRLAAVDLLLARGNCDLVKQAIVSVHTRRDLDAAERDTMCALYWMADEAPHDQREFSPAALPPLPDEPTDPAQAAIAAWEAVAEGREIDRARRLARTALEAAPVRGALLYPRIVAARALIYTGDFTESITAFDAVVLEARRRQVPATAGWALMNRAKAYARYGMLSDARIDLERALEELPSDRWHPMLRPAFAGLELALTLEGGRVEQAERIAATDFPATAKAGFSWNFFEFGRGMVRLAAGDAAAAAAIFEETGRRMLARRWNNPALLAWRSLCAVAYRGCGRHDEAARMCAEEIRLARRWGDASSTGGAHLGAAIALQGTESLAHMEQAVAILRHAPSPIRYATALIELGEARLSSGVAGDARSLLAEAERVAAAHGAMGLANRARTLIASTN